MKFHHMVLCFTLGFVIAVVMCGAAILNNQQMVKQTIQTQCGGN